MIRPWPTCGNTRPFWGAEKEHIVGHWGETTWAGLRFLAAEYRAGFKVVHELLGSGKREGAEADQAVAALRETGKKLIQRSEAIALEERQTISSLLRNYRPLMIGFLVLLTGTVFWLVRVLIIRLVKPLHMIEEATEMVDLGDHAAIPWDGTHQGRDRLPGPELQQHGGPSKADQRADEPDREADLPGDPDQRRGPRAQNNPLNNISTSCQILLEELEEDVSDYHRELLTAIDEQVAKARDIVSSLLEFARQREFELRREDLKSVVQEALKLVRGELPRSRGGPPRGPGGDPFGDGQGPPGPGSSEPDHELHPGDARRRADPDPGPAGPGGRTGGAGGGG